MTTSNHLELEYWNHLHGLHIMELVLTPMIWLIKVINILINSCLWFINYGKWAIDLKL